MDFSVSFNLIVIKTPIVFGDISHLTLMPTEVLVTIIKIYKSFSIPNANTKPMTFRKKA